MILNITELSCDGGNIGLAIYQVPNILRVFSTLLIMSSLMTHLPLSFKGHCVRSLSISHSSVPFHLSYRSVTPSPGDKNKPPLDALYQ